MTALWKAMLAQLTPGLGDEARRLLHALGQRPGCFPQTGLLKFGRPGAEAGAVGPQRFVLRVRAEGLRWRHSGVSAWVDSAVLEANGLPVALVKLASAKANKKGRRFRGSRRLHLHFDHAASAVKGDAVAALGVSKSPPSSS